jgi:uncharacterized protein (TIGR02284 family)
MQNEDAVSTLNHLISIAKDGYNGMDSAAQSARDPQLKSTLMQLSRERNRVATELQNCVRSLGGDPDTSGTTMGAAHRGFMDIKAAISANTDKALVEECERGEDKAVKEFREALAKDLPADTRRIVETCFGEVRSSHNKISALKHSGQYA